MTHFLLLDGKILPKKELHCSLWVLLLSFHVHLIVVILLVLIVLRFNALSSELALPKSHEAMSILGLWNLCLYYWDP